MFRTENDDGDYTYHGRWLFFLPRQTIDEGGATGSNAEMYKAWYDEGHLIAAGQKEINDSEVWNHIHTICRKHSVEQVAFDNNRLGGMRHNIERYYPERHFKVFGSADSLTYPMEKTEGVIKSGRFVWHNNPIVNWCFGNCGIKESLGHQRRCLPVRGNPTLKIDGVISWLNGFKACLLYEEDVKAADLEAWYDD